LAALLRRYPINTENLKLFPVENIPEGKPCGDDLVYLWKLGLQMQEICEKEDGIGLSAVQVGIPINFFVIDFYESFRFFVNCEYQFLSENKIQGIEGCLSIKDTEGKIKHFQVERFEQVRITGKELIPDTMSLVDVDLTPKDYYGVVFQHEIDHSFGILISDIGKEVYLWKK
jgi:peptide deformylase